jgi:hypothetical protein
MQCMMLIGVGIALGGSILLFVALEARAAYIRAKCKN